MGRMVPRFRRWTTSRPLRTTSAAASATPVQPALWDASEFRGPAQSVDSFSAFHPSSTREPIAGRSGRVSAPVATAVTPGEQFHPLSSATSKPSASRPLTKSPVTPGDWRSPRCAGRYAPMACRHPPEERLRVYEGRATPRPDRALCGLCGELLYDTTGMASPEVADQHGRPVGSRTRPSVSQ
jgi:hypothetical protein